MPTDERPSQSDIAIPLSLAAKCETVAVAAKDTEIERLREALTYYAKPRTYGTGEQSILIDDSGVARRALGQYD